MAWQLIYTSAPRLLEAGRSGFGTVARHRQISPLLAAAVERASQFARLPGLDTMRSIYCHRIFNISGARFHVLSCIRDAGADYTGRTNHLAHHLVAEAREVARLRDGGPTPADVLLGMRWLRAWNEPPRQLESDDEVSLAELVPQEQPNGRAWARLTGAAENAGLLASGEASRASYVVAPAGTDLRAIFGESMRLCLERAWETSFTTALQPSDETADLRWIGLDADSPLLSAALQSGRAVLDLTAPERLPRTESPVAFAPAAASPDFGESSAVRTARVRETATVGAASSETRSPAALSDIVPEFRPSKPLPWKWIGSVAGVAVAGLGIAALLPLYHAHQEERQTRREILEAVKGSGIFDTARTTQDLTAALAQVPRENLPGARQFSNFTVSLANKVTVPNFATLRESPALPRAQELAKAAGLNLPKEIGEVAGEVDHAAQTHAWLERYQQQSEDYRGFDALREHAAEAAKIGRGLAQDHDFEKLRGALETFAERKQAEAIRALLQSRMQPREKEVWFQSAVTDLPPGMADAQTHAIITDIKGLLVDWSFIENHTAHQIEAKLAADHDPWPEWLTAKARQKAGAATRAPTATSSPEAKPSVPAASATVQTAHYFVDDKAHLAGFEAKELDDRLNFELEKAKGNVVKLAFHQDGKVRENFQSSNNGFRIKGHTIEPEPFAPPTPFTLIGRDPSTNAEVVAIYAGHPADGEPIFGKMHGGLRAKDGKLLIDCSDAGLKGVVAQPLWLDVPGKFDGASAWNSLRQVENWQVDLGPFIEMWKKAAATRESDLRNAEAELQAFKSEKPRGFSAKALADAVKKVTYALGGFFSKDGLKYLDEAQKAKSPGAACNSALRAISVDWHDWKNTEFAKADDIFNAGAGLQEKEGLAAMNPVHDTVKKLDILEAQATTNEQKRWITLLEVVKRELGMLGKNDVELADWRTRRLTELETKATAAKEALAAVKDQPMLESRTPLGIYRLLVETPGGNKLPLVEFTIP